MKKLSSPFARMLAVAGCALVLGSCNRADYAMLPKASTYYGEAAHRSTAAIPAASEQPTIAVAPAVAAAPAVATAPAASQAVGPAALAVQSEALATTTAAAPAAKPTLVQRMMAKKVMKKMDKITARVQHKDATASTARLNGNLRTGIIFGVVGILLSLLNGVSGIFGVIGLILVIIGIIFVVLWLLDQV